MNREKLYLSIKTEEQAQALARKQGFSERTIVEFSTGGGWLEHYRNTGEQFKIISGSSGEKPGIKKIFFGIRPLVRRYR